MQAQSSHYPQSVQQWLQTPLGEALLHQEARVVEEAFDGIFGEQCLQLGMWGEERTFLRFARTQRCALVAEANGDKQPSAIGKLHQLPVQDDSVDSVLLPHTLDYSDRPHEILREADRVLTSHGSLVVLGFKPGGLWGIRRLVPGAGLPPDTEQLIAEKRLRDWLKLLDFTVKGVERYFFRWPLPGLKSPPSPTWEARGRRWWPEMAACYMLTAQKRVSTLTPVRPVWRQQTKVVTGLAKPANRVARIRFEPND